MPHLLIIDAPYYSHISDKLIEGATEVLKRESATYDQIDVPGVLEIPTALSMVLKAEMEGGTRDDGFIVLGCVIRGETTHYDIVANESARALLNISTTAHIALGNGIQTVENETQAVARADKDQLNKGGHAATAALEMIKLRKSLNV